MAMRFLKFPDGQDLWVVKWYDKRQQMHELSGSPSMEILLQRIDHQDPKVLRKMTHAEVGAFLARQPYSQAGTFRLARLDESSIPAIRNGQVYRAGRRVGDLPSSIITLDMPGGERLMREVFLGEELHPRPKDWTYNYRLLNPSQYELLRDYDGSRCIVRTVNYQGRDVDVVIPRSLIEQVFYFPDSVIIRAAAKGGWDQYEHELVSYKKLSNGLETGICPDTGAWKVLLRTEVRDQHALMMALFTHSPYARQRANQISSNALVERKQDRHAAWSASGQIPWDPAFGPYLLRLRGFMLSTVPRKGSDTFLATHVAGMTAPEHLPVVRHERENSNREGAIGDVDWERPRGGRSQQRGDPNRNIASGKNSNPQVGNEGFDTTATSWLLEPRMWKQEKDRHTSLEAPPNPQNPDPNQSDETSTGPSSGRVDNPGKASMHSLMAPAVASFVHLEDAMHELLEEGFIKNFSFIEPPYFAQREDRGGLSCWNFLTHELRENAQRLGHLPRRGWSILNPRESPRRARAALVVRIELPSTVIHWIEIERRTYETGMRSPVLANLPESLADSFIDHTLHQISENEGVDLAGALQGMVEPFGPPLCATLYQHSYRTEKIPAASEGPSASEELSSAPESKTSKPIINVLGIKLDSIKTALRRVSSPGQES